MAPQGRAQVGATGSDGSLTHILSGPTWAKAASVGCAS